MMTKAANKVLIVGGGIGGLSLGIALRKKGIEAEIIEIQQTYNVYGAGIIQQSNAIRALDAIGVADEAMRRGSPYGNVKMGTPSGHIFHEIGIPPMGKYPVHNGISRRTLHEILYEECLKVGVKFRMDTTVQSVVNEEHQVKVTYTDGIQDTCDVLVAADGIYSKVRKLVFGDYQPEYKGASVWRYTFPRPKDLETGYMYMGKKSKLGLIPTTEDTIYMFVVSPEGENPKIPREELVPKLRGYMEEYDAPFVKEVLSHVTDDPEAVNYRPLEVMKVPLPWYKGRVIMIGDAAHATVPQLGSGAALAIEDAVVLTEELAREQTVDQAFEKHMERRYDRCKFIVDASETLVDWEKLEFEGKPLPEGADMGALIGKATGMLRQPI
jgi:2-polyprenyl-6-methoxyphenol hydroxylase-like FAD-dependent oxidoreductase